MGIDAAGDRMQESENIAYDRGMHEWTKADQVRSLADSCSAISVVQPERSHEVTRNIYV
jgi:hypothetical protein